MDPKEQILLYDIYLKLDEIVTRLYEASCYADHGERIMMQEKMDKALKDMQVELDKLKAIAYNRK